MSKNITIQEGLVARNFTGVKKLSTTQMNSTEKVSWIPEDEVLDYVDLKELKVTANGTYKAEDKNCDGFSKVKVDVPSDVLPQKTITTNGEYDAMQDDGRMGYGHVTVNVPGGGGGPFTVLFLDDEGNVLKKQENVPYGGYASCTALDGTILNGLYFKGWNPVPKNVQFNMTCRPVRGDYVITPGEIADDWETIVADGGAHYPLGAYKPLVFNVPAVSNFIHEVKNVYRRTSQDYMDAIGNGNLMGFQFAMHMVKVAEGEDGTSSSWLSDGLINFNSIKTDELTYTFTDGTTGDVDGTWADSAERKYLNEYLLQNLPLVLQNSIKEVNKTYKSTNVSPSSGIGYVSPIQFLDKTCIDSIWVPSLKEMHTLIAATSNYSAYQQYEELSGIDYSTVFIPSYGADYAVRSVYPYSYSLAYSAIKEENTSLTNQRPIMMAPFGFCL